MTALLERCFHLRHNATTARTEILAGLTTFLTMSYIIVVNPAILSDAGMPFAGVLLATVLVSALSSIFMGLYANLPYALAPGMGINAFFTYTLVLGHGMPWPAALGAVFVSGIVFFILTVTRVRTLIVEAIPGPLRFAVAAGIGFFLTLIGLQKAGVVVTHPVTMVTFGGLNVQTAIFFIGLIVTGALVIGRVKGALVLGILLTSLLALAVSPVAVAQGWLQAPLASPPQAVVQRPSLDVMLKLDLAAALSLGMILPVFSLLFVDLFDSLSTLLGVAQVAGMIDRNGQPRNLDRALIVDSFATAIAGLTGSSSGTTYIESAAGVEEGGRTGLTAVVAGLLFLPFMFFSPLLQFVPAVATAPVLVLIGVYMVTPLRQIAWKNFEEAIPAFLAIVMIPLTYSITQGIVWGFLVYTALKLLRGRAREVHWMLYIIDVLAIVALVSAR